MKLTDAERRLLAKVCEAGSVHISRQRLLAAGEWLPFTAGTALALVGKGKLRFTDATHLEPTGDAP